MWFGFIIAELQPLDHNMWDIGTNIVMHETEILLNIIEVLQIHLEKRTRVPTRVSIVHTITVPPLLVRCLQFLRVPQNSTFLLMSVKNQDEI